MGKFVFGTIRHVGAVMLIVEMPLSAAAESRVLTGSRSHDQFPSALE
jgi:hypothetical protein